MYRQFQHAECGAKKWQRNNPGKNESKGSFGRGGQKDFCGAWRAAVDWKKSTDPVPSDLLNETTTEGLTIKTYKDVYEIIIRRWINNSKRTLKNVIKKYCTDKRTQLGEFPEGASDKIKKDQKAEEDIRFEGCADAVWDALLKQYIPELATEPDNVDENKGKKIEKVFTSTNVINQFKTANSKMDKIIDGYIEVIKTYREDIKANMDRIMPIVKGAYQQYNTGKEKHK